MTIKYDLATLLLPSHYHMKTSFIPPLTTINAYYIMKYGYIRGSKL